MRLVFKKRPKQLYLRWWGGLSGTKPHLHIGRRGKAVMFGKMMPRLDKSDRWGMYLKGRRECREIKQSC